MAQFEPENTGGWSIAGSAMISEAVKLPLPMVIGKF